MVGGICSATIQTLAETLEVEVQAIEQAVEEDKIELLNDTAEQKGRKERDRPTDPSKRSLSLVRSEFAALREQLDATTEDPQR